eukprot:1149865-Pelagomonas_calceolata.AAC.9
MDSKVRVSLRRLTIHTDPTHILFKLSSFYQCCRPQVKGEVWKGVASALNVAKGHKASVAGVPLVTGKGAVTVPSDIPEGASIR